MGTRKRRSDRCGRPPLRSPGRPPLATRSERQAFWTLIATGMSSEAAAIKAGVSQPLGTRWCREAGGMPPAMFKPTAKPLSGRYLSFVEREEIALLLVQSHSVQEIGRRLGRSASTISREVRRNATSRSGALDYRATVANGTPNRLLVVPNRRSLPGTPPCNPMWKRGSPVLCVPVAATRSQGPRCRGRGADTGHDRIDNGHGAGARNRSQDA